MPDSFCETPDGLLLVANGLQPVLRWDGLTSQMETAGVKAPTTACTLAASALPGPIVGAYTAYVRFVDSHGNYSDLSPLSNTLTAQRLTGSVRNVTNATPMVVTTTAAHNLLNNSVVKITGVGGATGANSIYTITVLSATTFSLNDSFGSGDYNGGGTWVSGIASIVYTGVPVSTETKVVRRQILRNTDGQAQTYYVDLDLTDLSSATFSSNRSDSDLQAQQAQPLLDTNDHPLANAHGIPPNHKAVLAHHLNRMFLAVEVTYAAGSCVVTLHSATVTGIGTEWTAQMVGRFLWVSGAAASYPITAVNETAQTLTLASAYQSATNPYASYAIRPAPAERRLVYYSEAGLPESWPAVNALAVQEDGDEITGLMPYGSFLYFLERRHVYRFTFQGDPAADGYVFLSTASRGCLNNRCWIPVEDSVFMLDEQGVHAWSGGRDSEPVSLPVQDLFRRDGPYSINWSASDFFHGVHFPRQETVRFYVALSGHYLPRHALCYNYRLKRWWLEEYDLPLGSSARVEIGSEAQVYLGTSARRVLLAEQGTLDGPDPAAGTVRGTVTAATLTTLTDSAAAFSSLAGFAVTIDDGTGKGQTRIVASHSATALTLTQPWLILPDTTSVYQVGGVRWRYRSGWFRYVEDEQENPRRVEVVFDPARAANALMTVHVYLDHATDPVVWAADYTFEAGNGVRSVNGSADLVADLTKASGFVQRRLDGRRDHYVDGPRFVRCELSGVQNLDRVTIYQATVDGVQ